MHLLPSCSRSTVFSAIRYSITFCWSRVIHPATVNSKNCSGTLEIVGFYPAVSLAAELKRRLSGVASAWIFADFAAIEFWHTTG
jgi:hypothetical protein